MPFCVDWKLHAISHERSVQNLSFDSKAYWDPVYVKLPEQAVCLGVSLLITHFLLRCDTEQFAQIRNILS